MDTLAKYVGLVLGAFIVISPAASASLEEALDTVASGYTWSTSGAGNWFEPAALTHDASDAAQSPVISPVTGGTATLQTSVTGPGVFRFWWRMDGDAYDADYFVEGASGSAYLDYLSSGANTGEWIQGVLPMNTAIETLNWRFSQLPASTGAAETAYLDEVTFTPLATSVAVPYYSTDQYLNSPAYVYGYQLGKVLNFSLNAFSATATDFEIEVNGVTEVPSFPSVMTTTNLWTANTLVTLDGTNDGQYSAVYTNGNGPAEYELNAYYAHDYEGSLDFTAADFFNFYSGGTSIFEPITGSEAHDGVDAVESTPAVDGFTELVTDFSGPGILKFWWKFEDPADLIDVPNAEDGRAAAFIYGAEDLQFLDLPDDVNVVEGWVEETVFVTSGGQHQVAFTMFNYAAGARMLIDELAFTSDDEGPVVIVEQPESFIAVEGTDVTLSCLAYGQDVTYEWYDDTGTPLGVSTPELLLEDVSLADVGGYYCVVSGAVGPPVTSETAELTIGYISDALEYIGDWYLGGNADWYISIDPADTHDGVDAMVSPAIDTNSGGYASLETTVEGPGIVSFWWKYEGDFYDGELKAGIFGGSGFEVYYDETARQPGVWSKAYIIVDDVGQTAVYWSFEQFSGSGGQPEVAYVDQVEFTPLAESAPLPFYTEDIYGDVYVKYRGYEPGTALELEFSSFSASDTDFTWLRDGVDAGLSDVEPGPSGNLWRTTAPLVVGPATQGLYSVELTNDVDTTTFPLATIESHDYSGGLDTTEITNLQSEGETIFRYAATGSEVLGDPDVLEMVIEEDEGGELTGKVQGPGTLYFRWRLDADAPTQAYFYIPNLGSEAGSRVLIDQGNWIEETVYLPDAIVYDLQWLYFANSSAAATVKLDQVRLDGPNEGLVRIVKQPENYAVDEGGDALFTCLANGAGPLLYEWFDALDLLVGTGPTLNILDIGPGENAQYYCRVTGPGPGNSAVTDDALLLVVNNLGQAVEYEDRPFVSHSLSQPWFNQSTTTNDGIDALQSGLVLDSQSSALETEVVGPRTVSFNWKVSSEQNYDFLQVYVNETLVAQISGNQNWAPRSFYVPEGTNQVRWVYVKDSNGTAGQDAGWVDQIAITLPEEGQLIITEQPLAINADLGADVQLSCNAVGQGTITYLWFNNVNEFIGNGPEILLDNVDLDDVFGYYCVVSNGIETINTNLVQLEVTNLGEAVEYTGAPWVSYGIHPWLIDSAGEPHGGLTSVKTRPMGNAEQSTFQTTFQGPGSVSFFYKVDSEEDHDFLDIYLNNTLRESLSGEIGWSRVTFFLSPGENTLRFRYRKDGALAGGEDAAWVDDFTYTATFNYGTFLTANGLTPGDPNTGAEDDYDGDGVLNVFEHFFATNPKVANKATPYLDYNDLGSSGIFASLAVPLQLNAPPDVNLKIYQATELSTSPSAWTLLAIMDNLVDGWQFVPNGSPSFITSGRPNGDVISWVVAKKPIRNPPVSETTYPQVYLKLEATLD